MTTRLKPLPSWNRAAHFLFVQVSFDLDQLLAWRDTVAFDGNVYAGVMVLPSASMARKLVADIPSVPQRWIDAVGRPACGVKLACELARSIADSGDSTASTYPRRPIPGDGRLLGSPRQPGLVLMPPTTHSVVLPDSGSRVPLTCYR